MNSDPERQNIRTRIKDSVARHDADSVVKLVRELTAISTRSTDVMFSSTCLTEMNDLIVKDLKAKRLRTYIVRSVTVEPLLPYLTVEAVKAEYVLDVHVGGYGSYADELLSPTSALSQYNPDLVLVLLDLDDIAGQLPELCADGLGKGVDEAIEQSAARIGHLLRSFRQSNSARILLQGLVIPDTTSLGDIGDANLTHSLASSVRLLNERLASVCRVIPDCAFFDTDRLAARFGRRNWRDTRLFLSSRLQVSPGAFGVYAAGIVRTLSALFRAPRKVLCTDLDNTLWGGVLGEDGIDGIATGSSFPGNCFYEYQRYLKQLSARGILLAIVSKNNDADVREAFVARSADLAVRLDDFVATKISWGEKAHALRELSQDLSLGLDSFVFVDDNPVECAAIELELPDVAVVNVPLLEPWKLVEALSAQSFFDAAVVTDDDVNRFNDYKAQTERTKLESISGGRDEFLGSLGIICTFVSALQAPLARSVQLMAKTNQFNLTTRRYSAQEIEEFANDDLGQAIAVRVRDRFGDAGVVGLALTKIEGDTCHIDSLLLSCRVIGRGIETALLANLSAKAIAAGAKRLVGEFIPTKKNAPCASFYLDHGFLPIPEPSHLSNGVEYYEIDLTTTAPVGPPWITLEGMNINEP